MTSAWKRSVAAVVFVAALGSADPAPGGQQADQPKDTDATTQRDKENELLEKMIDALQIEATM